MRVAPTTPPLHHDARQGRAARDKTGGGQKNVSLGQQAEVISHLLGELLVHVLPQTEAAAWPLSHVVCCCCTSRCCSFTGGGSSWWRKAGRPGYLISFPSLPWMAALHALLLHCSSALLLMTAFRQCHRLALN